MEETLHCNRESLDAVLKQQISLTRKNQVSSAANHSTFKASRSVRNETKQDANPCLVRS